MDGREGLLLALDARTWIDVASRWRCSRCLVLCQLVGACRQRPLLTGVLAAGTKGALADVSSQTLFQDGDYNAKRTMAFALWNIFYCGLGVYLMYSMLIPRVWPTKLPSGDWHPLVRRHVAFSVAFDNLFATPFICMPTYYACHSLVENPSLAVRQPGALLYDALRLYRSEAFETLALSLGVWIPCHTLTFAVVPVELRTHWVAACSFLSLSCMSLLQHHLERRRPAATSSKRADRA